MQRQGEDFRGGEGYNAPSGAAGFTAPQPQAQAQPPSTPGASGNWDAAWEKRVRKLLPGETGDLNDPEYRNYLNKKLKKLRGGQAEKPKPLPAGTKPTEPTQTGGPDPPPTEPMQTGGPEPLPGGGAGGPVNPEGGWMPNRTPLPWGGGGRENWGQGPAPSQGYPSGGAGYPNAPNYPGPGQSSPLPGYPGGPVQTNPGEPNPMTPGGYPEMPPAGRGYPRWPGGPGGEDPYSGSGPIDPYGSGGPFEGQERGTTGPTGAESRTTAAPVRYGPGETPPPGRGYPRWPGGRAPEWGPRRPWGPQARQVDPMAAYQAQSGRTV
ncbi:MAG TPA: hypothetical protein VMY37_24240 [Thermoguttaceae bacterium]|nr:hypothetical protein [Thermoguttaceae bacterium]